MNVNPRLLLQEQVYEKYALEYYASLPLEHFMESTDQSQQKQITLESLALVQLRRPEVQTFAELLVQYPVKGRRRPGQVVPDNMVVLCEQPIRAKWSFTLALQPVPLFWVLEYVSKRNPRKDYTVSLQKYERYLKVPYCLMFYPEKQDLRFFHHNGRKYVKLKPDRQGRYRIKELDLEIGLLDGWVRYWYKGELLPLPAELQQKLDEAKLQAEQARQQAEQARQQAEQARQQADEEKRRADDLQQQLAAAQRELADLRSRRKRPTSGNGSKED